LTTPVITNSLRQDTEIISLVGFAHGISHFFHLFLPSLFPWFMPEFDINFTQAGLLTALCFSVSAVGQAPGGFVVDALGAHRVLMGAISLFIVAALMVCAATNYGQLCVAAVLIGVGNSVFHPADFSLLNRNVSTHRLGHAFSVHGLSGNLGWALAPALLAALATWYDWRLSAAVAALVAFMALLVFVVRRQALQIHEYPTDGQNVLNVDKQAPVEEVLTNTSNIKKSIALLANQVVVFRTRGVWMSFVFFLVVSIAFGGLQNFSPSVFIELYGVSAQLGAWWLSLFLLGGSAGMVAGGFMVAQSRFDNEKTIAWVLSLAAVSLVVLSIGVLTPLLCSILMFVSGLATGLAGPARDMLVRQSAVTQFGVKALGRVYGMVYSGLDVGIAVSPLIFGFLLDRHYNSAVLMLVAIFYCFGGLIALRMGQLTQTADTLKETASN